MSSSIKTVSEFLAETPALDSFLKNAKNYFAHRPAARLDLPKETLQEHIDLVNLYFERLTDVHGLDAVIDRLILFICGDENIEVCNYLKKLFVNTIVFHDFGKINERFQADKMLNTSFIELSNNKSPIGSTHASLGAFLYLSKHLHEIAVEYRSNPTLVTCCIYLSYSIFRHHSRFFDDDSFDITDFQRLQVEHDFIKVKVFLSKYLQEFGYEIPPKILQLIGNNGKLLNAKFLKSNHSFAFYALCRLNFSLLTASDYLATNEYSTQKSLTDFGVISSKRIDEIYDFVTNSEWLDKTAGRKNYNKILYQIPENYSFKNPKTASGENLNIFRTEMGVEVIRNIRQNSHENLFYIEAPTGGGKTNLSALAALELLKIHAAKLNKVFYVFPFTTLITQAYQSLKETLGLHENEIIELHSNAGMKEKVENDALYGSEKLNYIHNLFVNFPFTFLSHIRFFDILKTNEKEANYLLHRLANSVVVIDELQSYSPEHWDKIIYFIKQYAETFNIKFILMSATLPKIDKLNIESIQEKNFTYLLPDAKEKYFQNPNFSQRVSFNFDYFESKDLKLTELADRLLAESAEYSTKDFGSAKPKGSVYAIIEFIFKKTATEFYQTIKDNDFFDEIFLLSGTILPHRRKEIINFLKNKENRRKKILLITTQVVEAGVDIDMDLGFKDRSLIDSDEQLAGRINRNVNKRDCKLYLFNYNSEAVIYGDDKRLELTKKYIDKEIYQEILTHKDFDRLYDIVLQDKNEWNNRNFAVNFKDYETLIDNLKFRSVHEKFKLIEQNNISCFIPLQIPLEINGANNTEKETVFTMAELAFLAVCKVYPNAENNINGAEVFDIYLNLIKNKQEFIKQRTDEKILQGIMSKFVISLFATDKIETQIVHFSDEIKSEYGYKYLEHWEDFYTIDAGMNDALFHSNETQFL